MYVLNIWHTVPDYAAWKKTFDSDPLDRQGSGVRRYAVSRPTDDGHTVLGALEFESLAEAETFAGRLRELWKGLDGDLIANAGLRISEVVEERELVGATARRVA